MATMSPRANGSSPPCARTRARDRDLSVGRLAAGARLRHAVQATPTVPAPDQRYADRVRTRTRKILSAGPTARAAATGRVLAHAVVHGSSTCPRGRRPGLNTAVVGVVVNPARQLVPVTGNASHSSPLILYAGIRLLREPTESCPKPRAGLDVHAATRLGLLPHPSDWSPSYLKVSPVLPCGRARVGG